MILSVDELKKYVKCDLPDEQAKVMLQGIEKLIRRETNNNFQNRKVRFNAATDTSTVLACCQYLKIGDTIQISQSINDGLYVITAISDGGLTLDKELYPCLSNLVTKVQYDEDVKQGVANLIKWEVSMRDKVGISSESISRHSVSYFNMDGNNSLAGYPKSLMGFLEPYYKARF